MVTAVWIFGYLWLLCGLAAVIWAVYEDGMTLDEAPLSILIILLGLVSLFMTYVEYEKQGKFKKIVLIKPKKERKAKND